MTFLSVRKRGPQLRLINPRLSGQLIAADLTRVKHCHLTAKRKMTCLK